MVIKAVFKGKDGSLGYEHGKEYELVIKYNTIVVRKDNSQRCEYKNIENFLMNWDVVRKAGFFD